MPAYKAVMRPALEYASSIYMCVCVFMSAMYSVCMHTFHSAHICNVYNSVKCVHYFYNQVIFIIIL